MLNSPRLFFKPHTLLRPFVFFLVFLFSFLTIIGSNAESNRIGEINIEETLLLINDVQTEFSKSKTYDEVIKTANKLIQVANALTIPIYASQHTPATYGYINPQIAKENISMIYEKTTYNMLNSVLSQRITKDLPSYQSVILIGLEAHICVEQTAMAFRKRNIDVFIVAEGISSVNDYDKMFAIERFRQYGCYVETIESLVYKLLKNTIHPRHDEIVSIIEEIYKKL